MLKLLKITITLLCIQFSGFIQAENMLVDGNILYTVPDAGSSDDFHTGKIISAHYNYYYRPWLAFTTGIFFSEEIFDETRQDIVGTYQASLETHGLTIGIRPEYVFSKRNKIYTRLGALLYETKIRVEEYFEPGITAGSSTDSTDGYGYFIDFGWSHLLTEKLSFQLELNSQNQLDLFDGKTSAERVFDLNNTGFSLGLSYAF